MKGYIYIMSTGCDPVHGWPMNDPILRGQPTLGACMPNVRRLVKQGDYIYVITGSVPNVQQYVVGGFQVDEKINALEAFERFPRYRLREDKEGNVLGNIIVDEKGEHHPLDHHDKFEERIENYIVGKNPIEISSPPHIERARRETLPLIQRLFNARGTPRLINAMGRWRRLGPTQIEELNAWLNQMRG